MNRNLIVFLAASMLSSAAHAVTFNVTRTDDPVPDGCKASDCSLREAVIDANGDAAEDLILLPAGVFLLDLVGEFDDSENTGDLDISTDMNFAGAPSIIDGQNLIRIMEIHSGANVTLMDLTLRNAMQTYNSGALQITGGSLVLDAVTFDSNSAGGSGSAIYAGEGAIVDIDDCLFTNNSGGSGTSIHINGNLTVRNTIFRANEAAEFGDRGSVAYISGSTSDALFENVTFDQNSAVGDGGAIVFLGRKLRIDGLVATANHSDAQGGVVFVSGSSHTKQLEIVNAVFNGNSADEGGAISFGGGASDTLDIRHSSFVSNSSDGWGGAVKITGGTVDVTNSTFSGNQTTDTGGAIHLFGDELTVQHSTFSGNSAANGGDAMYIRDIASFGNNLIDGECFVFDPLDVTSLGGNVEGNGDTCDLDAGSDLVNQSSEQLGLQPLRDNIGATPTHELTSGSVARGQGETTICESVMVDQLYDKRGSECNSGAVESNRIFRDGFESGIVL